MLEHARWIWSDGSAKAVNAYRYFRTVVRLPDAPVAAAGWVSADTRYGLVVNGRRVQEGPARGDMRHQCVDPCDLAALLLPGENVIGALVVHYGVGTCASVVGRPGFILEASIECPDGSTVLVATGDSWRVSEAPYLSTADRMSIQLPFPEEVDLRREPVGWSLPGFDDSAWSPAFDIAPASEGPWQGLEPRDIPLQARVPLHPVRLFSKSLLTPTTDDLRARTPAERMERATSLQPAPTGTITLEGPQTVRFRPASGEGLSAALDFGKEVSGIVTLSMEAEAETELLPLIREQGMGFIAMKPLGGGLLPDAKLALRYLLQFDGVVPDPGIQAVDEMREILEVVDDPVAVSPADAERIEEVRRELGTHFCHRCDYCQPCQQGIQISTVLSVRSNMRRFPLDRVFGEQLANTIAKALDCVECGECEARCPYQLAIREMLDQEAQYYLAEKARYEAAPAAYRLDPWR